MTKQHDIEHLKTMMAHYDATELKQVRNWVDNRLAEADQDEARSRQDNLDSRIDDMDEDQLTKARQRIDDRLVDFKDDQQGSADVSADDEKKKYIAQHGANPNAQTSSQNVPQPESGEVKDLQNEKSREEHDARGPAADGSH